MDIPEDFLAGLAVDPDVLVRFDKLPPSHQREYIEFYLEAKKQETRDRRMAKIVAMLSTE
jgi:uncharacterized protein YdeI (YjbR/CyaY-like superfamily)